MDTYIFLKKGQSSSIQHMTEQKKEEKKLKDEKNIVYVMGGGWVEWDDLKTKDLLFNQINHSGRPLVPRDPGLN